MTSESLDIFVFTLIDGNSQGKDTLFRFSSRQGKRGKLSSEINQAVLQ
jgi:hypothetical protein